MRDVIGKPVTVKCKISVDYEHTQTFLTVCLGEYTHDGVHKTIISFRKDVEISDEVRYVVDQDFQLSVDELARSQNETANRGRITRMDRMF